MDIARHDQIDRVGTPLVYFHHSLRRHATAPEIALRSFRRQDPEPQLVEAPRDRQNGGLIGVIHRHEDRALERQAPFCRNLGLGERHAETVG